jgi:hypothetical protein
MEHLWNGFDTVSFTTIDQAYIIGIHRLIETDTRAKVFLADYTRSDVATPALVTVYTEEFDTHEQLLDSTIHTFTEQIM